jgi:hypothetical protein
LRGARDKYGPIDIPRECPERVQYEQDVWRLIGNKIGRAPDLICLAGYDQWLTDWTVDRYYPKILNVHPGDTTKGYSGLHWIPTAKAILSGDQEIRATLFIVDQGEDTGPVLAQSRPLEIASTLRVLEAEGTGGLVRGFNTVMDYAKKHNITSYDDFEKSADVGRKAVMRQLCTSLQSALKKAGDWEVFPYAVHALVARGRAQVVDRVVYVDGRQMPDYGYRMDQEPVE